MATEVLMPSMGEGVNEASLVNWLKKVGDKVDQGEPLLLVSTDKVDTEIPAPASGVLTATHAKEGQTVKVNDVLALIGVAGDVTASGTAKKAASTAGSSSASASASGSTARDAETRQTSSPKSHGSATANFSQLSGDGKVRSSPLVRKMAKEHDLDLGSMAGSGLQGRITKRDVEERMAQGAPSKSLATVAAGTAHAKPHTDRPASGKVKTAIVNGQEMLDGVPVRRETMSRMRQLIADHMVDSIRTSAHVTTVFEIDLHKVVAVREKHKKAFATREGFSLTFTPFLLDATVTAIKKHPIVNCSVDGYDILHKADINLGCAVALENGLIVPVIKKAGELNLLGIARRLNDLVVRARSKKLQPDEVQGGTFSVTNPGGFGSIVSNPIINQPQVAILSIGAIVKRPVVVDDMIAIRPMCMIGLTFDHRVIDGEGGAKFLATLKDILENYTATPD